jgi:hypothetical protein
VFQQTICNNIMKNSNVTRLHKQTSRKSSKPLQCSTLTSRKRVKTFSDLECVHRQHNSESWGRMPTSYGLGGHNLCNVYNMYMFQLTCKCSNSLWTYFCALFRGREQFSTHWCTRSIDKVPLSQHLAAQRCISAWNLKKDILKNLHQLHKKWVKVKRTSNC